MDIGLQDCDRNYSFDNIIPIVSPILRKFQIRHNRFKYLDELKNEVKKLEKSAKRLEKKKKNEKMSVKQEHEKLAQQKNNMSTKQKYKSQIPIRALKFFFGSVLYKNVPLELFGTWKNFKAVKKTVYYLLKTCPEKILIKFKKNEGRTAEKSKTVFCGSLSIEPLLKKLDVSLFKITTWMI